MDYSEHRTKQKRGGHAISTLLIVVGVAAMLAGGAMIWSGRQAVDAEAAIADEVTGASQDAGQDSSSSSASQEGQSGDAASSDAPIDFDRAKARTNCAAWLQIPDAGISLPVMQASKSNPEYWLRHDLSGRWTWSGTLFIDSRTDAEARNALVFGHHMTSIGGMLTNIYDTWQQGPFDAKVARGAIWTTESGRHEARALCALKVYETNQEVQRMDFADDAEFRDWLRSLVRQSGAHARDADSLIGSATHAVVTVCCSSLRSGQPWRTVNVFVY